MLLKSKARPGPLRWLWYSIGGGLPEQYNWWVLHDITCRTWILRHFLRCLLLLAVPVAAVILFLPAPPGLRILTAFTAGGCAMMFFFVHGIEATERKLVNAGYPGGTGETVRAQRSVDAQRRANARRRERSAARALRH
jgi:hypothetical protein